jgi:predicted AlkP superfamily pyrophosphatase or phosphodiesterase
MDLRLGACSGYRNLIIEAAALLATDGRARERTMKHGGMPIAGFLIASIAMQAALLQPAASQNKPDLVVLVAVDQFSAALFDKWRSHYKSGLKRIVDEAIVYSSAYQSHGATETCPGHSTMLTGKHPAHTGIVANDWYDAATGKQVYCVAAPEYTLAHSSTARKVGPTQLNATTLGDWMKEQQPGSRVLAVSGKDRASITMAGHHADGVFWFEDSFGFTTFVAAGEDGSAKIAPLARLNEMIKSEWTSPPDWTYFEDSCRTLEADYEFGNVRWRSKLPPEAASVEGKPPEKIRPVHLIDRYTLQAAVALIETYALGRRGVTDLLAVSFSGTDFVGHGYGTQGPEMCDQIHRLDAQIGEFLMALESVSQRVLVVMTGDHGASDFVERLAGQGFTGAKRIDREAFLRSINAELKQQFSLASDPLVTPDFTQFYAVGEQGTALSEPLRTQVIDAALDIFKRRPEIEEAFSLTELLGHRVRHTAPSDYSLRDRYSQGVMAGRSGDIIVAFKSGISTVRPDPTRLLVGHSGPYRYDSSVPIIFWWPGIKAETRIQPIDTTAIAPTLANIIGVKPPNDLDGACLNLGYLQAPKCAD